MKYFRAILSQNGKDNFLHQLEIIVESVKQNRIKIERRQQDEKSKRDGLNIQLAQLVDKARQYAKVLKDFQEVYFIVLINYFCKNFFLFRRSERMKISFPKPNNFLK
jgi:hypothetical protein